MHKVTTKALLDCHGIPVPPGTVVQAGRSGKGPATVPPAGLRWPVVVKPAAQGSTIGVTIVRRPSEWRAALRLAHEYDQEAVVESYIAGREIAVSVLGGTPRPRALPAVEIVALGGFYDYTAKYVKGRTRYLCPAPLPADVGKRVQDLAIRTYQINGCEGAARVDFRVTQRGLPYVFPGRHRLQAALERPLGRIHLAGDFLGSRYTETAIASGAAAADALRRQL